MVAHMKKCSYKKLSQIRWTDIPNSRIQAQRAWRLVNTKTISHYKLASVNFVFFGEFLAFSALATKRQFFIFYFQINIFRLVYCDNDILFFIAVVRRKTIYEYHRVNMKDQKIANNTAIRLKALPRCNMKRSCKECLALTVTENDKEVPVNK